MPVTIVGPSVAPADELRLVAANVYFVPTTHAFGIDRSALALDQSCLAPPATTAPRLTLNRPRRTLVLDGQEIQAAPRPFSLLWLLAESIVKGGGVVSQRQIESHLWGKQAISRTAVGDAVRDLRDVLDAIPQSEGVASELIENRQGQGYLLNLSAEDIELVG